MAKIVGIKGVLFDFDETLNNTLLGSEKAWDEVTHVIQEYLDSHQILIDRNNLIHEIKQIDYIMNRKRHYNRDEWWDQLLCKKIGSSPPKEVIAQITTTYWDAIVEGSQLYPDTLNVLKYLTDKKYQLGLMSDTDQLPGMKRWRIKQSGLEKWFDAIVISGEDGFPTKPSPEPYHELVNQMNLSPKECAFIGDKPFTDIKGANDVGMASILVQRHKWYPIIEPDYYVNSLSELKQIL